MSPGATHARGGAAKHDASALDESTRLLDAVETGPRDGREGAEAQHLRGQAAFDQRHGTEAAGAAAPGSQPPRAVDALVDAFALRLTDGFSASAPALTRAVQLPLALNIGSDEARRWLWLVGARASGLVAMEVWGFESWHALATGQVQVARDLAAPVHLQFALTFLVVTAILRGELSTAARLIDEDRMLAEATGNPPVAHIAMLLAARRGQEAQATELIESIVLEATGLKLGRLVNSGDYARGAPQRARRHDVARDAARRAFECDPVGLRSLVSCPSWQKRRLELATRISSPSRLSGYPNGRV